ncbi:MAG: Na+/H+ antiporter NhaC family protein [Lentisphaeria bacterium]|nr:Na+/H+ antiporter NhaC family protein [Lentisphaeria bacterium]
MEREARFKALVPFIVFMVFYLGLSVWAKDFYFVPMPVAFVVASATAFLLNRKQKFDEKVEIYAKGMGETNIMIMCLIFILAGAFSTVAKAMGAVDATVLIARHLIPSQFILAGFFLISCFISLAIGTSCGTIAALTPIAVGLIKAVGMPPALMLGAVIGGAMFGDNMSMISDTTIAATRTQNVAMRDKFITNFKMILPAAVLTVILYYFAGRNFAAGDKLDAVTLKHIFAVVPYIFILAGALLGMNVMALLFCGMIMAGAVGILNDSLTFKMTLTEVGRGALGMSETLIVAILAGGLLALIRYNGGISYLIGKIEKMIKSSRGCEAGIALLAAAVNLFTANNTVAIVVAGPIAKMLSDKYNCDGKRIAGILDTASCAVQGLIPYGAQILIAVGIANGAGIEVPAFGLTAALYYPMLLAVSLAAAIAIGRKK